MGYFKNSVFTLLRLGGYIFFFRWPSCALRGFVKSTSSLEGRGVDKDLPVAKYFSSSALQGATLVIDSASLCSLDLVVSIASLQWAPESFYS